jgi:hypothetical protein
MAVAESYPGCFSTVIAEARLSKNAAVGSPLSPIPRDTMKAARSTNMGWSGYDTLDWSGCDEVEQVEGKRAVCRSSSTPVCRLTSLSTTITWDFRR